MARLRVLALMEATTVGGPSRNLIEFARRAREGAPGLPAADIGLVTYRRGQDSSPFADAAAASGMRVFILRERRRFDVGVAAQLRDAVEAFRPDIIQSHNIKSHLLVRWLGLHKRLPWIAFNHGYTATDLKDRAYNLLDRWSLPAAFRVVAVCEPFARRLEHFGVRPANIRIQHNSVRPFQAPGEESIERIRREFHIDGAMVLAVGRLSREKGHEVLLESAQLLKKKGGAGGERYVIVGDGPERPRLEQRVRRSGLSEQVVFAGHRDDVRPFYAAATAMALPSHSEGSPNVVLEAMAAGVPVAATRVGGVPELLEHGVTGLIVPPGDPAALAGAIMSLLADAGLRRRLSTQARLRAAQRYTPEAYCRGMLEFYTGTWEAFRGFGENA